MLAAPPKHMALLSSADYRKLRTQLSSHEGRRRYPYRCTAGKLTVGAGYNIDDRGLGDLCRAIERTVTLNDLYLHGLTEAEIDLVLTADIAHFEGRVAKFFPQYLALDPVRQRAVVDFAFNLGKRALGFTKAIAALKKAIDAEDAELKRLYFVECASHMMHSLWASQVGDGAGKRYDRAERIADMIKTGQEPRF